MTSAPRTSRAGPVESLLPTDSALPVLVGALASACVLVAGLALGGSAAVSFAAALAVLVAVVGVVSPFVALALLAGLEISQTGSVLLGYGVPSPLVLTQLVAFLALAVSVLRGRLRLRWSPVVLGAVVLLVTRALTVLTARDPDLAFATVTGEVRDMLTFAMALALLWLTREVVGLVRVMVLVLSAMAALTVVQEFALDNSTEFGGLSLVLRNLDVGATTFRHSGPIGDSNFWGRVLAMFAPFALALLLAARSRVPRVLWAAAILSLVLGIWLTQSRGTFLAFGAGAVVFLLLAGWRYARWLILSPVLLLLLLVLPATGARLETLGDLAQTSDGGGDLSLLLRLAAQEVALNMLAAHPLLGIGAGNYTPSAYAFLGGLPFATAGELDEPLAPHNAYLEFAAEGGVIGLLGLLALLGSMAYCAGRSWLIAARRLPPAALNRERLLAAACCAALVSWSVASVVLHVRQFRTLLLLAAIIAALDALLRDRYEWTGWRTVHRRRIDLRPALVLVLVGLLGALAWTSGLGRQETSVQRSVLVLTARDQSAGAEAYHYDLLTRGFLVPTLIEVMTSPSVVTSAGQAAGVSGQRLEGLEVRALRNLRTATVELEVRGTDTTSVQALSASLPALAAQEVNELETLFVAREVPSTGVGTRRVLEARTGLLLAVTGLWLAVLASVVWLQLERLHRRVSRQVSA